MLHHCNLRAKHILANERTTGGIGLERVDKVDWNWSPKNRATQKDRGAYSGAHINLTTLDSRSRSRGDEANSKSSRKNEGLDGEHGCFS